ncbi:hypothetical protein Dimus_011768 [Dionaea muscipula]
MQRPAMEEEREYDIRPGQPQEGDGVRVDVDPLSATSEEGGCLVWQPTRVLSCAHGSTEAPTPLPGSLALSCYKYKIKFYHYTILKLSRRGEVTFTAARTRRVATAGDSPVCSSSRLAAVSGHFLQE